MPSGPRWSGRGRGACTPAWVGRMRPTPGARMRAPEQPTTLPRLMSVTVVGSIAFDSVTTPFGTRERMLGGSAVHFSLAASFFDEVHVVGPVGEDFGEDEYDVL